MKEKSTEHVISYYNEHVKNKLNDYISVNPRIEEAWRTLVNYAPEKPLRILEVGCGIGSVSYRLSKHWPGVEVNGLDISTHSIQIAEKLFVGSNLKFQAGILKEDTFDGKFDLIIFMDVYEHISVLDRPVVHAALHKLLNNKGRMFLSVPTPHNLKWCLKHKPETMQPVDEFISFDVIGRLAADTGSEVLLYQVKDIWNQGDYAHVVFEKNDDFEAAFFRPKSVSLSQRLKRIFNKVIYKVGSTSRRISVRSKLK
ncbi:class I SAM-dependent methyltransferase [Pedobacter nyackensis]|uniref:class I SAM-dependent methyltransferase n=1 Tax=Pedobacter nyackensis TaxID=475255 RepID=UPI00292CB125|nr:class I SAM-dependent methyltransferase [Pedobacter nyackensis]